jgi:hypothetical protein
MVPRREIRGTDRHVRARRRGRASGTKVALRALAMSGAGAAFQDGLGERRQTTGAGNQLLDLVIVHEAIGGANGFEAALKQRAGELASFQHASFPRLRGVGRLSKTPSRIVVATDHVSGVRLSDLLAIAERRLIPLEYEGAIALVQQLVNAVAVLHETVPHVSHGAIAPERLMFTSEARLMVVDHSFGAAIEKLGLGQERSWKELRVALPVFAGQPAFDRRADVTQVGAVALALLIGRLLNDDEYPSGVAEMIEGLNAVSSNGLGMLPAQIKAWLRRAMQLEGERSFATALEAKAEFENAVTVDDAHAQKVLTAFLKECQTLGKTSSPVPAERPAAAKSATPPTSTPKESVKEPVKDTSAAAASKAAATSTPKKPAATTTPAPPMAPTFGAKPASADTAVEPALQLRRRIPYWDSPWRNKIAIAAAVLVAVATAGVFAVHSYATVAPTGVLAVNTDPDGVEVRIDGKKRGSTPLTVELPTGEHKVELVAGEQTRAIPVTITEGGHTSQFVELPKQAPDVGQLNVRTDPPGATVTVDGQRKGVSPLVVDGLLPGSHTVGLQNALSTVTEQVTIQAGATAALVVPLSAPQGIPVSGWVAVNSPIEMQLFEDGRLVGSSRSERIMMSVGDHSLQIVNEALGYRSTRTVQVAPGRVSPVRIEVPKGSLALNAAPWAEVWVDGERAGETPIGNVTLPIGNHDVLFRHPDFGEQRHTVTVTLNGPARLSVDMRKRQ